MDATRLKLLIKKKFEYKTLKIYHFQKLIEDEIPPKKW